jgi:hemophore-related protein
MSALTAVGFCVVGTGSIFCGPQVSTARLAHGPQQNRLWFACGSVFEYLMEELPMVFFALATSRAVVGGIAAGAISAATLFAAVGPAAADPEPAPPPPPNCTAADLAQVSSGVAASTSVYLFSHPDVNTFFTSLKGQPRSDQADHVKQYMDANPQTHTDLEGIRQPLTDFRNRCNME